MELKAYLVRYDLPSSSGNQVVVLVRMNQRIEEALEKKTEFKYLAPYCKIQSKQEVPLSLVKLSDLSVTEFFMLQGANV
ncbi:hypothetical protein PQE68_gp124 [Bacillus phage vB_BanS_Sophrita]|uniref:Uncharacterized protein n=1 Tax=Bacillus phage vB_BanS_Sophrita TaxID=2894790 RepID=A0AAE9CDF3_9CAUD|nr:hypothetical protein PQE68_gp124 [Bacillus phage vB_BanS_Sophrita]UGO50715.1 hypothetical protein SOPHRITA_124 [Bacillus phage vB_BanS_Sophrita]